MAKFRGRWTRLCPSCRSIVAHKTLYAKTEAGGRTKWLRLFWACILCNTLNHVVLPAYRLQSVPEELPSSLVTGVVNALKERPLDFDELITNLRGHCPGVRHVFNSEVAMALEYLKGHGVVTEEIEDLTQRALTELRAKSSESKHLQLCPVEMSRGVVMRSMVSLYSQRWLDVKCGEQGTLARQKKFAPVGVLCLRCGYQEIDPSLVTGT
jgi:hypothetical protein